jgi:O-antigen ligase
MAVADFDIGVGPTLAARFHQRIGASGLFVLLCAFTLTTFDGGDIAPRVVSAVLLLLSAVYFLFPPGSTKFIFKLPAACLLGMTLWGVLQTLFSPHKIVVDGWAGVLFWFTAAVIALVGASVFQRPEVVAQFRLAAIYLCTFVCVLDLLEQATRTNKFFWLIPSRYNAVFGTFAYWNNFSQFVELLLPITLWQGLSRTRPNVLLLSLSAIQIGAVVASGSRAGSLLVLLELISVVIIAYVRNRSRGFLFGAAAAVILSGMFIYAAGFGTVLSKLRESDQLAVRRHINESSIAMLKVHPLTGWGLDTYVPIYRMFALYDDGTYVNRAHNDWLQFAVEGGVPFAALFAALFAWSIRPAIRSGWGIGIIAIGLHALVDYPFARLGVCGWYFAIISIMSYQSGFLPLERDKPVKESIFF